MNSHRRESRSYDSCGRSIDNATQDQTVVDDRFPGLAITLPAGVQILGWDGVPKTRIAVERLMPDALPTEPPPVPVREVFHLNFGRPMGGVATDLIPVKLPNVTGLEPGEQTEIWYYDPVLKRFISRDPIGLAGGVNMYGYVGGDPVSLMDPYGLFACSILERLGSQEINLSVGVGAGVGGSGSITLSSRGVDGGAALGVGMGVSTNASVSAMALSGNVGSTNRSVNVQTSVVVGGGIGTAGVRGEISVGTNGLDASVSAGVGLGASIISGIGINGNILRCDDLPSEVRPCR